MDYAQQVQNGIALLDQYWGPDWRSRIDKDRLRMSNVGDCILGQLFGEYYRGIRVFDLSGSEDVNDPKGAAFHGFHAAAQDYESPFRWDRLRNAWLLAI